MLSQVTHVLINTYSLCVVLLNLTHEVLYYLKEIWVFLLYDSLISLELLLNMSKEVLKMLLVIQNKLINNSFVQFITWELIWVTLDDDWSHVSKLLRDYFRTVLHYEQVLILDFLEEFHIGLNIFNQRLEFNLYFDYILLLLEVLLFDLCRISICCCDQQSTISRATSLQVHLNDLFLPEL